MIIKNVKKYTRDLNFKEDDIIIQDDIFSSAADDSCIIDGNGYYAIPGLIDLHFHGCGGYDFCDGTSRAIASIAAYEAAAGITGIAPATMTPPFHELEQILARQPDT